MTFKLQQYHIQTIQSELNNILSTNLTVDGLAGDNTLSQLSKVSSIDVNWNDQRKLVAFIQYACKFHEIAVGVVDGFWGPQTDYAYDQLIYKIKHGHVEIWEPAPCLISDGAPSLWPLQNEQDMNNFYGAVGTNQTKVTSPYPLRLAWDTDVVITKFTCHVKVKDSVERVLKSVLDHYGLEKIQELGLDLFAGSLNVRKKRGGTTWSTHSWGSSFDFNSANNRLRWGDDRAVFAKPEYDFWNDAWENEGAVSLGRAQNRDWMHYQFARLS